MRKCQSGLKSYIDTIRSYSDTITRTIVGNQGTEHEEFEFAMHVEYQLQNNLSTLG